MILNFSKFRKSKSSDLELSKNDGPNENPVENNSDVTEGRVTIHFSNLSSENGALMVGFFVANGFSQKVKFSDVPLVLLDSERRILAQQSFSGDTIGEVYGGSTKACVVRFMPENVYAKDIPDDCQVCFDVRPDRHKTLKIQYQSLPESLSEKQKQDLEQILDKLPPVKHGEVSLSPLCAKFTKQSNLLATVIIRNASNKTVNLQNIPLAFFDAKGQELTRGVFEVKDLKIIPYKALLWTFEFDNVPQNQNYDLSSWHISVEQS